MTGVDRIWLRHMMINQQLRGKQPVKRKSYLELGAVAFYLVPACSFSAQPQPNWATYVNKQYRFGFQYPPSISSVQTTDYKSRYPFGEPPVAFLSADITSVDTKGYLTINISGDTDVVARCSHPR